MPPVVSLLSHTPEPERLVAAAARNCYSDKGGAALLENFSKESVRSFLQKLSDLHHESPLEHVSFTFAISGVSRSLLAQLTRHRIASFSVKSQRYVSELDFTPVVPPEIAALPEAAAVFDEAMNRDREVYTKLVELLSRKHLETGLPAPDARKKAQEDARYVLPNAAATEIVMTMNARALLGFFRQRLCTRAQWEIRAMADEMLTLVRDVCPILFSHAGPACVGGPCPEGNMSCGQAAQMRARYNYNPKGTSYASL